MTKLAEWLIAAISILTLWYNLLTGRLPTPSFLTHDQVFWAPFVLVAIIAVVVLAELIRGIRNFKDYPEAAEELKKQIIQAREDLTSKGFKFD